MMSQPSAISSPASDQFQRLPLPPPSRRMVEQQQRARIGLGRLAVGAAHRLDHRVVEQLDVLLRLVAVELHALDLDAARHALDLVPARVLEHGHALDLPGDARRDLLGRVEAEPARRAGHEVEADQVRPGVDRGRRVVRVHDSADLDAHRHGVPSSLRSASPGSGSRISDSPTRNAQAPALCEPRHVLGPEDAALATTSAPSGTALREALGHGEVGAGSCAGRGC